MLFTALTTGDEPNVAGGDERDGEEREELLIVTTVDVGREVTVGVVVVGVGGKATGASAAIAGTAAVIVAVSTPMDGGGVVTSAGTVTSGCDGSGAAVGVASGKTGGSDCSGVRRPVLAAAGIVVGGAVTGTGARDDGSMASGGIAGDTGGCVSGVVDGVVSVVVGAVVAATAAGDSGNVVVGEISLITDGRIAAVSAGIAVVVCGTGAVDDVNGTVDGTSGAVVFDSEVTAAIIGAVGEGAVSVDVVACVAVGVVCTRLVTNSWFAGHHSRCLSESRDGRAIVASTIFGKPATDADGDGAFDWGAGDEVGPDLRGAGGFPTRA